MTQLDIKLQAVQILETEKEVETALQVLPEMLHTRLEKYTWVGFYFMNNRDKTLHLGPYTGNETDHKVIPYGKGICGQVAESGKVFTVEDVSAQDNYIACSIEVKSEIVVPLYLGQDLIGQIDIDSNTRNAFTHDDELFLIDLCSLIATQYGESLRELATDLAQVK